MPTLDSRELCFDFGLVALLASCTHIGPKRVVLDPFDYSMAIADSWTQQTLLNIVKR